MQGLYLLIVVGVLQLGFALLLSAVCVAQWYLLRKLDPQVDLRARLLSLEADSRSFTDQLTRLRTQKAGRASKARREEAEAKAEMDPDLEGLSAEEAALFGGLN